MREIRHHLLRRLCLRCEEDLLLLFSLTYRLPHPAVVIVAGLRGPADSASENPITCRGSDTQYSVIVAVFGGVVLGLLYLILLDGGVGPRRRPFRHPIDSPEGGRR